MAILKQKWVIPVENKCQTCSYEYLSLKVPSKCQDCLIRKVGLCCMWLVKTKPAAQCSLATCPTNQQDTQNTLNRYVKAKQHCSFPTSTTRLSFFMTNCSFCSFKYGNHVSHSPHGEYPTAGASFDLVYINSVQL